MSVNQAEWGSSGKSSVAWVCSFQGCEPVANKGECSSFVGGVHFCVARIEDERKFLRIGRWSWCVRGIADEVQGWFAVFLSAEYRLRM